MCPLIPTALALLIPVLSAFAQLAEVKEEYLDFNYGSETGGEEWVQSIQVLEPAPRAEVRGDTLIRFKAPGMKVAKALCWRQPTSAEPSPWGHDRVVAEVNLAPDGAGSFTFAADEFPHGPVTLRILAHSTEKLRDIYELQLFNKGGVPWNRGAPASPPPGARGLPLVFSDDFDGPLSISRDGRGARYNAHKPRFGDFSGWAFADPSGPENPFEQVETYLRVKARKPGGGKASSGLIATVNMDGEGFWAKAPCYVECRFLAQSAPGTWPAFWTITGLDKDIPGDELDIVECYGGVGKKHPNHPGYSIVSHFWGQVEADGQKKKGFTARPDIMTLGGRSYWSTTFHTYGLYIGLEETVYYFDDIEVLRHPTNDISRDKPHCLLVNLAIGGISGWSIDLERYGNGSDMWVDYIRAYAEKPVDYKLPRAP
jgi:hypothetical protein